MNTLVTNCNIPQQILYLSHMCTVQLQIQNKLGHICVFFKMGKQNYFLFLFLKCVFVVGYLYFYIIIIFIYHNKMASKKELVTDAL